MGLRVECGEGVRGRARRSCALVVAALVSVVAGEAVHAQSLTPGDPWEDYLRLSQLLGRAPATSSFAIRPLARREDAPRSGPGAEGPWKWPATDTPAGDRDFGTAPIRARVRLFANSGFPRGGESDGSVWQGKGLTTALDVGTALRWKGLTLRIEPTLRWTENRAFELGARSVPDVPEFSYPWRRIDLPQRFGPDSFWDIDPGQSELRVDAYGASAGVGTRNRWWGPGIRSAIVMSNNGAGFPHAFLGTRGPRDIGIGSLEATWIFGRLEQSDWFDPAVENDDRFLTGLVLAYSPSFLDGLSVGLTRVFYGWVPEGGVPLSDLFLVVQGVRKSRLGTPANPFGDDDKDQLLSLFGRWVLPESGFEVYGEWARNDHAQDLTDFILEPEHSQGYTLGLQKAVLLSDGRLLALNAELTHLERSATQQLRATPVYYAHHIVTQGYTHRGQVLGAGVGPGGNQQFFGAQLYGMWGRTGLSVRRRVHDNDAYYVWAEANDASFDRHDVSIDIGGDVLFFLREFELGAGLIYTRELNRYFYGPKVNNFNLSLSARWRPNIG